MLNRKENKQMKKIFIVALAFVIVAMSLTGCSSKGKTLMSLDGSEISVNMFQLFLSRQKGMLCSSYGYGTKALADSFWDTVMDVSGTTYNDYYTELVLENTKTYLAALKLFDEKGLKLPDSYVDEIDAELDRLVEQDGSGSKSKFNSVLAEFGVNYNILREAYIIEAKISDEDTPHENAGEVISLDGGITVACGKGAVTLLRVLPEGKARMNASDFIRGRKVAVGDILG